MKIKYQVGKKFIENKSAEGTTIFDVDTSTFYSFNQTGSDVFILLKKKKSKEEITLFLTKKYDISHSKAQKDVTDFLRELRANKIIFSPKQKERKR
jgi:hypothetical protein